jgi:hypothetical protein
LLCHLDALPQQALHVPGEDTTILLEYCRPSICGGEGTTTDLSLDITDNASSLTKFDLTQD